MHFRKVKYSNVLLRVIKRILNYCWLFFVSVRVIDIHKTILLNRHCEYVKYIMYNKLNLNFTIHLF